MRFHSIYQINALASKIARKSKQIIRKNYGLFSFGLDMIEVDFERLEDWLIWWGRHPEVQSHETTRQIAQRTQRHGIREPLTGRHIAGADLSWNYDNLRESGISRGINARNRAVLYTLDTCFGEETRHKAKIYGTEAITPMALLLRGYFPKFIGSEYSSDPAVIDELYPIPTEDLTHLTLRSGAFDAVVTTEVLEHVPSIDDALREMARVLRPGGWHIGTCPFAFMDEQSILKAVIEDGELKTLMEPEYHGDPMGTGGSLVFEIPGWNVLARAKAAGFSRAYWKYLRSGAFGIVAEHSGGVFVLCLQK
jgi:SAM-dependent methyltransferase